MTPLAGFAQMVADSEVLFPPSMTPDPSRGELSDELTPAQAGFLSAVDQRPAPTSRILPSMVARFVSNGDENCHECWQPTNSETMWALSPGKDKCDVWSNDGYTNCAGRRRCRSAGFNYCTPASSRVGRDRSVDRVPGIGFAVLVGAG